ncbi:MAG: hypothetical protein ACT4QC_00270 [Planctomycetaceae bacterium]
MVYARCLWRTLALTLVVVPAVTATALTEEDVARRIDSPRRPDPESEALKEKVIEGVRQNYARLPVVRCRQVTSVLDPTVEKPEIRRGVALGRGELTVEMHLRPRTTTETDLLLAGDSMRAESLIKETDSRWAVSMHGDIWMSVGSELAERKYREDMGGEVNIDPRNVGAFEQRKKFLDELRNGFVSRREAFRRNGIELLALELTEYYSYQGKGFENTTRFEFDPARNYLPVRVMKTNPETKKVMWVHDFDYQEILPGSAWFLKKGRQRYYATKNADTPDDGDWGPTDPDVGWSGPHRQAQPLMKISSCRFRLGSDTSI